MVYRNWQHLLPTAVATGILFALGSGSVAAQEQIRVVSTSTMIADWVEFVGQDKIEHTGILEPGVDPHIYEPVPTDSVAFEEADLIFYNGFNLEPALIKMMKAVGSEATQVALGELVEDPLFTEYAGRQEPDPHVWGDVGNVPVMVNAIRDALIATAPEDMQFFTAQAAELIADLKLLDQWVTEQVQTIPVANRTLVTTHDAFEYYINAYGLRSGGTLIGVSTEEQPSARIVAQLSDDVKTTNVPTIFAETTINPALIRTVADEAGVRLASRELYSDSIGEVGSDADTYIKMIVVNTQTIVEGLGGQVTPFVP